MKKIFLILYFTTLPLCISLADGNINRYGKNRLFLTTATGISINKEGKETTAIDPVRTIDTITISSKTTNLKDITTIYELGVGYTISDNLRIMLNTSFLPNIRARVTAATIIDDEGDILNANEFLSSNIDSYGMMLNVQRDILCPSKFNIYAMGGLGLYHNHIHNTHHIIEPEEAADASITYFSNTTTNLAWQVGVGAYYKINHTTDLDIHYLYTDKGKAATKDAILNSFGITTSSTTITEKATFDKLRNHQILLGLRFYM